MGGIANIRKKSGKLVTVDTERLAELIFSDEDPPELTRSMIEDRMKARQVPEYPRYSVTEYGAVYCMVPQREGRTQGRCISSERKQMYQANNT